MYYLVYISTAVSLMTDVELKEILTVSRRNNEKAGVTGMLLYCEGTFIQLLEGDEENVHEIYSSIQQDTRHKNLIKLVVGEDETRNFADWSMGFATTDKTLLSLLEGYVSPIAPSFLYGDDRSPAMVILKTFAENNWVTA